MTSKTKRAHESLDNEIVTTTLTHMATLEVVGVDAAAFLQRQCMNDVKKLDHDGAMQWSGLLSAKGRVLFLFRLVRVAADRFLLLAPAADGTALLGELRRYVLRSKLRLVADGWQVLGTLSPAAPHAQALAWDDGRWVTLREPAPTPMMQPAGIDAAEAAWIDLDVARGIPHIGSTLSDRFTPQMLGLAKRAAFSLSKGCYPGQEIVARTHYLGQQKREWTPLGAPRALRIDEAVLADDGRELGRILQIAPGDPRRGAAVLPVETGSTSLRLEDGSLLAADRAATA